MAFTNPWDTTFPADTQLANLIGQDIRNFKLDIQQRMGAISGLDASKPNFGGDTQPANWNGVLFFATDTGRVYQFNNPSWTDVTLGIRNRVYRANTVVNQTGDTNPHTIYSVTLPQGVLNATSRIRIIAHWSINAPQSGANIPTINFGATALKPGGSVGATRLEIVGGNFGNASAQTWTVWPEDASGLATGQVLTGTVNTLLAVTVTLTWTPTRITDTGQFIGMSIELL
jgi:hypothetical protein